MINGALSTACRDQAHCVMIGGWRFTDEADATFKYAPFEATCPLNLQPKAPATAVRAQQIRVQDTVTGVFGASAACVRYVT
jgi:hypothetical protein